MSKFIINWNAGFGDSFEVIEAKTKEDALQLAYENWSEEAESNAIYSAVPYTDELADDLDL